MNIIPKELINSTLSKFSSYSEEEILPDQKEFMKNQPDIVEFLLQFTDDHSDEISRLALHLAHLCWKVFNEAKGIPLKTIPFILQTVIN
ncbi:hypothetical protein JXJ21_03985 [candidate division KSB1 bacterium]|nr:hypothetical protein [candidate division KSB1 bacterium]